MPTGKAILFSEMTPDASFESDFHHWYDTEHIPIRMTCNGICRWPTLQVGCRPGLPGRL